MNKILPFLLVTLLVILPFSLKSQTNPQTQPPDPQYFISAGGLYNQYALGGPTGSLFLSASVKIAGSSNYSISTLDFTRNSSSIRTGLAHILIRRGNFILMTHADGGVAVVAKPSTSTTTTNALGSFSGGGILLYDMGGLSKRFQNQGFYSLGLVRVVYTSLGIQPIIEIGIGKAF